MYIYIYIYVYIYIYIVCISAGMHVRYVPSNGSPGQLDRPTFQNEVNRHIYTWTCSHQVHVVQHQYTITPDMRESVMGPEFSRVNNVKRCRVRLALLF